MDCSLGKQLWKGTLGWGVLTIVLGAMVLAWPGPTILPSYYPNVTFGCGYPDTMRGMYLRLPEHRHRWILLHGP